MEGNYGSRSYIGRVGGLAVALGVGTAVATGHGVAAADDTNDPARENPPTSIRRQSADRRAPIRRRLRRQEQRPVTLPRRGPPRNHRSPRRRPSRKRPPHRRVRRRPRSAVASWSAPRPTRVRRAPPSRQRLLKNRNRPPHRRKWRRRRRPLLRSRRRHPKPKGPRNPSTPKKSRLLILPSRTTAAANQFGHRPHVTIRPHR